MTTKGSSTAEVCKQIYVVGKVQGVGFRNACYYEAKRIGGIKGWVRNLPSGDVEIVAQGSPNKIKQLVDWCHKGAPPPARVDAVLDRQVELEPMLTDFGIRKL